MIIDFNKLENMGYEVVEMRTGVYDIRHHQVTYKLGEAIAKAIQADTSLPINEIDRITEATLNMVNIAQIMQDLQSM